MKPSPSVSARSSICALLLLGAGGCSDPPGDPDLARAVIGPGGGIITSTDDVLTIAIPPGALEQSVELFIRPTDEPPDVFGQAYLVRPNPTLRYDVTVTYRQELPADTSRLAVGAVDAVEFEADRGRWEALPVLRVDRQAELVTGLDDGISIFYALLDDADDAPSGTSGDATTGSPTTSDPPDGSTTTGVDEPTTGPTDDTTTGPSEDGSGSGESTGEPAVSYALDVAPILLASCNCHTDGVQAGLSLTDGYPDLVEVASTQVPGLARVEPGAPEDSYLWHKLQGTHGEVGGTGDPMPAPTRGLDAGSLAMIEAWILDGAPP